MFNPRKKSAARVRPLGEDMEIDDEDEKPEIKPAKSKKDKSKKKSKKKTTTGLSFGDEVDEDNASEFKVKKTSRSKKIAAKIRAEVEEEKKENRGSYWGSHSYSNTDLKNLRLGQNAIPSDNAPTILNGDDLEKIREKDLSGRPEASSFRERVLDRMSKGNIPDANAIHAARKKREAARRKNVDSKSYIPLGENGNKSEAKKGSRIDAPNSDDEDQGTINMKIKVEKRINDDIDAGREDDDEGVKRWETNLIRGSTVPGQNLEEYEQWQFEQRDQRDPKARIKEKIADLKERISECKNNQARYEASAQVKDEPTTDIDLEERYTYFQEMRAWLKDYTNFINTKLEEMNQWHSDLRSSQAEKASVLLRRRQLDVKDSGVQFTFNSPKDGNTNLEPDVRARVREREARRTRRKMERQMKKVKNHEPGDSSDDELDPENEAKFKAKSEELEKQRLRLCEDVFDEYTDSRILLNRFNKWRESFPRWYKVCFVEECAGSVIIPIMKIEMNDWTPTSGPLESLITVKNAIAYSCQSDPPETMLLPFLIGKYPYDTILWWVNQVWDPMSTRQTESLVKLFDSDIFRSMPWATSNDEKLKTLLNAVNERLLRTINEDVYIPLLPLDKVLDKSSGHGRFFWRQWTTTLKLIRNITKLGKILSAEALQYLILDKVINGQLLLKLNNLPKDNSTLDRIAEIIELLPSTWFKNLTDVTLPGLMSLSRFVAKLSQSKSLYKKGKEILRHIKATEQLQLAKHQLPIDSILG